jgi:REP element-mobilizing transposase RayT
MVYDSSKHNRQSLRFKNFDYSQNGYSFVTIMCYNREHLFGKIVNSKIIPRSLGSIVRGFKIGVTKWFRINGNSNNIWQRNYYETIIFDPKKYSITEDYIRNNPKNFKG